MTWVATALAGYALVVGLMFVMQRTLLYPASRERPDPWMGAVADLRPVEVATPEGPTLRHWYRPPRTPEAPAVVVFHGNGGHVGHRLSKFMPLLQADYGVLLMEYRGYGGNPGSPSEAGLTADAAALLEWLAAQGLPAERLVLYGESLGSGLAIKLAAERPVRGIILEAPYTSIAEVAQRHYPILPARWLLLDHWQVAPLLWRIEAPSLVIHGELDRTIPTTFGRAVYQALPQPKEALFVRRGHHNDLFDFPEVVERVLGFLAARRAGGGT